MLAGTAAFAVTIDQIQAQIDAILSRSAVSGNTWSILIEDLDGNTTYYQRNPDTPRKPASNTKIYTTACAYEKLGWNHSWNGTNILSGVRLINKPSDNALADSLITHIGSQLSGSATYAAGAQDVIQWCQSIGIDMTGAQMYDGSGLSHSNRFTARQTLKLVRHMAKTYTSYDDSFPIGCVDGTLASRFCSTVGSGRVHAKTGTLTGVVALSGYIANPNDGKWYLFSILANNVSDRDATRQAVDDCANVMGQKGIPSNPPLPTGIVVDNANGGDRYVAAGEWGTSTSSGYWATGSRFAFVVNQPQDNTATWTPVLPSSGVYKVYAWWVTGSNRSPGAAYTVNHKYSSTLARVNQQTNGNKWNLLGEYKFNAGEDGSVVLSSAASHNGGDASAVVSADAIQFVYVGPEPVEVIVDNTAPSFTASSNWFGSTSTSGYLGSDYRARACAQTSDLAAWAADLPMDGTYKVFARWTADPNRTNSAAYVVTTPNGNVTVNVNQQQNNGTWVLLGEWPLYQGLAPRVQLSCWGATGKYVVADGIRFVRTGD